MRKPLSVFVLISAIVVVVLSVYKAFWHIPDTKIFPEQWEGKYKADAFSLSLSIQRVGNEWSWAVESPDRGLVFYFSIRQYGAYWRVCSKEGSCYYNIGHNSYSFSFEDNSNVTLPDLDNKFMVMPEYSFYRSDNGNITLTMKGYDSWSAVQKSVFNFDFVKQQ